MHNQNRIIFLWPKVIIHLGEKNADYGKIASWKVMLMKI